MHQKIHRYPCELSYCIEHEVEVTLKCEGPDSLAFAIERFRQDEARFRVGLMAILTTSDSGQVYLGVNAAADAACLGYATQDAMLQAGNTVPRAKCWAVNENPTDAAAEFHWFYPDCPSRFEGRNLVLFRVARAATMAFMQSGQWPENLTWA